MIEDYVQKSFSTIKQEVELWSKLQFTWMGRIAMIKMNILPRFVFIFLNMNLPAQKNELILYRPQSIGLFGEPNHQEFRHK